MATQESLTTLFYQAREAAIKADLGPDSDGGTCNVDTPAFRIPRCRKTTIEAAAKAAGVDVNEFTWFGGRRWFWLMVPLNGQGDRRSRMMQAAQRVLREAQDRGTIPGFEACGYCQMD